MTSPRPARKLLSLFGIGALLLAMLAAVAGPAPRAALAAAPAAGDIIFNEYAADNDANGNDFVELLTLTGGLDLRGLRVSDNEIVGGALNNGETVFVFGQDSFLADVPAGTTIALWVATAGVTTDTSVGGGDFRMVLAPGTGFTLSVDGLDGTVGTGFGTGGEALYLYLPGPDGTSAGTDNVYLDFMSYEGDGGDPPPGFADINLPPVADNAYYRGNTAAGNNDPANWTAYDGIPSANATPGDANPSQDLSGLRSPAAVAPTITAEPADQQIASGSTATLTVTATGSEPLSYQWYQGAASDTSTPVGTNSASFTTPALSATTSYWVRVSNSAGSDDSATATVTVTAVAVAPTITTEPADQQIAPGGTATLSVVATGTEPLSYQWYQGAATDTSTPVGTNSASFTTPALGATTSYWVRVSNSAGSDDSATATVTVSVPAACSAADTPISQVQGSTDTSPLAGQTVTVQGVVVGDYEGAAPNLRGFYLQDLAPDGDAATSEGVFVFNGSGDNNVALGQVVQVTGAVSEFQGQTQITRTASEGCGTTAEATPATVTLPLPADVGGVPFLERLEGMLVRVSGAGGAPLVVTEHFQLGRFGQVTVAGERLYQPTNLVLPGGPGSERDLLQQANSRNRIILDDALQNQNRDPIYFGRGGQPLSAANTLRAGDTLDAAVGVLTFTWAGNSASGNAYRVRPEGALGVGAPPAFQPANPRPAAPPAVGGTLKASAFNVLNYFLTLDVANTTPPNPADNKCGPLQNQECRGADSAEELQRQRTKLLQALRGLDADVLGLVELENTAGVSPEADLVAGLNALTAPGTYAFIETGTIGGDAIKVGIIYKPGSLSPVGPFKTLDKTVDPDFNSDIQRPSLAQTFQVNATGAKFTVVVNHLKSKGDSGLASDPACAANPPTNPDCDQGDGQSYWNNTRRLAAEALVDWLATDPTGSGDADYLILGDLNAYAKEDPIRAALAGADDTAGNADDNVNLILQYGGERAYSYLFDGQLGYLDHAIASPSLAAQVTGAAEWHINADEPSVLDYNVEFKSAGQQASLFAPDPFRTSDHDPVIVGMDLAGPNQAPGLSAVATYDTGLGELGAEIISLRGDRAVLSNAGDGSLDILDTADLLNIQRIQRVKIPALADLTSVAIHPSKDLFVAVAGASGPPRRGVFLVFRLSDGALLAQADIGRQPDSVEISPDGRFAVVAIEAQQVNAADDGGAGAIGVVDLSAFDPASSSSVSLQTVELPDLTGLAGASAGRGYDTDGTPRTAVVNTPGGLEPEGIGFAPDSGVVYVTLQENNAVVRLDLGAPLPATLPAANAFGLGQVNFLADLTTTGGYVPTEQLRSFRESDGVRAFEVDGTRYLVTADEGDTRIDNNGAIQSAVRGGRTVSVFNAATGAFIADLGDQLNALANRYGIYPDARSNRGGAEPEMLDVIVSGGRVIAAVGLERANAVAFVELTRPAAPVALGLVRTGAAPEGVKIVVRNGVPYAVTANEVAGTVTVATVPTAPLSVSSFYQPGAPRAFGLGALDADSATVTVTLTLDPAAGALSRTTVAGALAEVNEALAALTFTPAGGFSGPAAIALSITDGTATTTGTITLLPPPTAPVITAQPESVTIASGHTATLTVVAAGTAPLSYQWYRGPAGDVSSPVTGAVGATFTTPALTATTSYWVRVSNGLGSVDSAAATVTVTTTPPVNRPPTLTAVRPFTGLTPGRPFVITYEALAAAADASDPDQDPLRFRVEELRSGLLTKGGAAVLPGVTTLGPGESLVYTPTALGPGVVGFTVSAFDGRLASGAVGVSFDVRVRLHLPLVRR